jgi:OmpA-OmpF porin, OOP family
LLFFYPAHRLVKASPSASVALLLLLILMPFQPSSAGPTLSANLGRHFFSDSQNAKDSFGGTFGVGWLLARQFGIEYQYGTYAAENRLVRIAPEIDVSHHRLALSWHFQRNNSFHLQPYLSAAAGSISIDGKRDAIANLAIGADYHLDHGRRFSLRLEGGVMPYDDLRNYYTTVGFRYHYWKRKPIDILTDRDVDIVADKSDSCFATRKRVKVNSEGCNNDEDLDGVPDYRDHCPQTPAGGTVDRLGCPQDLDRDGVMDYADACPGTPVGLAVDSRGCELDRDRDGFPNDEDLCPDNPIGVAVNSLGCPLLEGVFIRFAVNKSAVLPEHYAALARAADYLRQYPGTRLVIQGHTDIIGKDSDNLALSQQRADNAADYLVSQLKIDRNRLISEAFASTLPLQPGKAAAALAASRRVTLRDYDPARINDHQPLVREGVLLTLEPMR